MESEAPELPGIFTFLGVFADSENVSLLLTQRFLPECHHRNRGNTHTLALREVTSGTVWFQQSNLGQNVDLIPVRPQLLLPNLTGTYRCTSPTLTRSDRQFQLDVIGKVKRSIQSWFLAMEFSF